MKLNTQGLGFAVGFLSALLIAACEKEPPRTEAPPAVKRAAAPADQPAQPQPARPQPAVHDQPPAADALNPENADGAAPGDTQAQPPPNPHGSTPPPSSPGQPANPHQPPAGGGPAKLEGNQLTHGGITMTVPAGWQKSETGAMSPMGPKAVFTIPGEGDAVGTARITHFPEMKGKQMDDMNIDRWLGQVTKPDGSPTTREEAKIETKEKDGIRIVTVDAKGTVKATMRDTAQPDGRLIAAIIDHPQGPHFIVAAGPVTVMDKAAADVLTFIESAKTAQ